MRPVICIYHSRDLDGFTSAAIVKRKYPNATLIGFDYGQQLPMDKIPEGVPIIMVDVSIPMPEMEALAKHSNSQLTWIDHHVSAIKEFEAYAAERDSFVVVSLKDVISACELAWKFFNPGSTMPTAIQLLGEYDTWRNSDKTRWENEILPFQFGMRSKCNSPETFPPHLFYVTGFETMPKHIESIINDGKTIMAFLSQSNELMCRRGAFEADFMGYRAICLNAGGVNSDSFKSVYDASKHDILMPFFYTGKYWQFSIYTDKDHIDCSLIAKQQGGGGHAKAAGFQVDDISSFIFKAHTT